MNLKKKWPKGVYHLKVVLEYLPYLVGELENLWAGSCRPVAQYVQDMLETRNLDGVNNHTQKQWFPWLSCDVISNSHRRKIPSYFVEIKSRVCN